LGLGASYYYANGVPRDYDEAISWFRKAADQGAAVAQCMLGVAYAFGHGVQQDDVLAYSWFNLAAAHGNQGVASILDALERRMSPSETALAQTLAHDGPLSIPKQLSDTSNSHANADTLDPFGLQPQSNEYSDFGTILRRDYGINPQPAPLPNIRCFDWFAAARGPVKIPLTRAGGTFVVPVRLNGVITLGFTVDSGAADVTVPRDVFTTLKRAGTIDDSDLLGRQIYVLADGSKSESMLFRIRSLKVDDVALQNVRASVSPAQGILLLGQSFLTRFKSWSIDNANHLLHLELR
jgi:hypothetical protein